MHSRYIRPEHKELYIAYNDPKRPVLVYQDEGPWPELPPGCWASPNVIEYYYIDWNNQNVDRQHLKSILVITFCQTAEKVFKRSMIMKRRVKNRNGLFKISVQQIYVTFNRNLPGALIVDGSNK